jgi:hypothetical protein
MTAYNSVNGEWAGENEQLLEGCSVVSGALAA